MNKAILSVSGAFISLLCAIVTLVSFAQSGEDLFAILAVIFAFGSLSFIGYGIDGTKLANNLANFFAGEEVSNE